MYFNHSFPSLVNEAAVSMAGVHQAVCPCDNANWLKCSVWSQTATAIDLLSVLPPCLAKFFPVAFLLRPTCRLLMCRLKNRSPSLEIFFFLAHAKHHMQQPHAEVFENQIGRSGLQKLCFEACLQRVLSKKVFLLLIKEALSFSV